MNALHAGSAPLPLPSQWREIRLQLFDLSLEVQEQLRPLLYASSRDLQVRYVLGSRVGAIALVDDASQAARNPRLLAALAEGKPCVFLQVEPSTQRIARAAQFLQELAEAVRQRERDSATDDFDAPGVASEAEWDSQLQSGSPPSQRLEPGTAELLQHLLRGVCTGQSGQLWLGFGPGAVIAVDLGQGKAWADPLALDRLRAMRRLPQALTPAAVAEAQGGSERRVSLPLTSLLWALGVAAAGSELLGAEPDWWHQRLLVGPLEQLARYSSRPLHREMARLLQVEPLTPSQLRRATQASVRDVRDFLQPCLFINFLHWE